MTDSEIIAAQARRIAELEAEVAWLRLQVLPLTVPSPSPASPYPPQVFPPYSPLIQPGPNYIGPSVASGNYPTFDWRIPNATGGALTTVSIP